MTTTTKTTTAPAKTTAAKAKPAMTKTTAKPAAEKAAPTTSTKIRWTAINGEKSTKGQVAVVGVAGDVEYRIDGSDKSWTATVAVDGGKPEIIVANVSRGKAYSEAVKHFKGETPASAAA